MKSFYYYEQNLFRFCFAQCRQYKDSLIVRDHTKAFEYSAS